MSKESKKEAMVRITRYIKKSQKRDLEKLASKTRIDSSEYIREGIDMVLSKYKKELEN